MDMLSGYSRIRAKNRADKNAGYVNTEVTVSDEFIKILAENALI